MFVNEFLFDSYGCPPPLNILSFINKGIYSEYQIQKMIGNVQRIAYTVFISHKI